MSLTAAQFQALSHATDAQMAEIDARLGVTEGPPARSGDSGITHP